ncbi:hypothetical protein PC116_g10576 [Phytophthora cactorum]|uniref:Uncharacterized protein n=1 Tax=Phytophthora cactorum TaxID=29920 RepID=A0A8T1D888_9STRA|nr:hypothetical protein PC115_g5219 [Phytophthora cactorum]KAG3091891.1 hypothetical protein PC122_g6778 [Phytophthora cactorum]KAG3178194.1 hypothetical protein C6341_g8109 [Phytophthora cactorum]KAG4241495.1 hypothetical protein PC116_g10576 [Phytophthora cactorum]
MGHDGVRHGSKSRLAFVGPMHVGALTEFQYVRVTSMDEASDRVSLVDPDSADEEFGEEIELGLLKRRLVSNDESELWPGTYVGHPIAFVQVEGPSMDQRTFGLVTDYHMADSVPWLHVHHVDGPCKIALQQLLTVIKSDWINYALQTAGGTNGTVLNAVELLAIMNDTLTLCTKSWELPAKVKNSLSIPYGPAAMVSVIRPDTLVKVRSGSDPGRERKAVSVSATRQAKCRQSARDALRDESDEESPPFTMANSEDIRAVQLQNRLLIDADQNDIALLEAAEDVSRRSATTFRPTALERQINDAIAHPDNKCKIPQCVLEYAQQAPETNFRRSPTGVTSSP